MVVVRFACCLFVCILRHLRFSLVQLVLTSRRAGWEYRRYRRQHGRKVEKSTLTVFKNTAQPILLPIITLAEVIAIYSSRGVDPVPKVVFDAYGWGIPSMKLTV